MYEVPSVAYCTTLAPFLEGVLLWPSFTANRPSKDGIVQLSPCERVLQMIVHYLDYDKASATAIGSRKVD